MSSAPAFTTLAKSTIPGFRLTDLSFQVPLVHSKMQAKQYSPRNVFDDAANPATIDVFAREVTSMAIKPDAAAKLPYLVYLQGGPGFQSPSPVSGGVPAWVTRAAKEYRVLLLDQRGTGRSSPVNAQTLSGLTPEQQAAYFSNFRSDSIVADCELIRKALHSSAATTEKNATKWSLLGQSYGGFVITEYLHLAPEALREVFFTGGLPILGDVEKQTDAEADQLYRATFRRVVNRNKAYYKKYPEDIKRVKDLVQFLRDQPEGRVALPSGGYLTPERFLFIGFKFGFRGGMDTLHQLLDNAFVTPVAAPGSSANTNRVLSYNFLRSFESLTGFFDTNPIYCVLHESIYCDGGAPSAWAAHRVMTTDSEFKELFNWQERAKDDSTPVYFTGEMVFPWMMDSYDQLSPLKECANILAEWQWPRLYGEKQYKSLPSEELPKAAALVYYDDMYVEREFSVRTAEEMLPDMRLWITNEMDHGGLHSDGEVVMEKLFGLANGTIEPR